MKIICPKCGSDQLKMEKDFSATKAIAKGTLFGLFGFFSRGNTDKKDIYTCLTCGNKFRRDKE